MFELAARMSQWLRFDGGGLMTEVLMTEVAMTEVLMAEILIMKQYRNVF